MSLELTDVHMLKIMSKNSRNRHYLPKTNQSKNIHIEYLLIGLYVPLIIASSISCFLLSSSVPSGYKESFE